MSKNSVYSDIIREHYHNPRHRGVLEIFNIKATSVNPACGDSISITGLIQNGALIALAHEGKGCMISQAVASILAEKVLKRDSQLHVVKVFRPGERDILEEIRTLTAHDVVAWIKLPLGPNRLKCALLALEALQQGLEEYARSHQDS